MFGEILKAHFIFECMFNESFSSVPILNDAVSERVEDLLLGTAVHCRAGVAEEVACWLVI